MDRALMLIDEDSRRPDKLCERSIMQISPQEEFENIKCVYEIAGMSPKRTKYNIYKRKYSRSIIEQERERETYRATLISIYGREKSTPRYIRTESVSRPIELRG